MYDCIVAEHEQSFDILFYLNGPFILNIVNIISWYFDIPEDKAIVKQLCWNIQYEYSIKI